MVCTITISIIFFYSWGSLFSLDEDFPFQSLRRRKSGEVVLLLVEEVSQDGGEQLRHPVLLVETAVVLDGENERIVRAVEGVVLAGQENVTEDYLGGESITVIDDWLSVTTIPAVN